MALEILIVDDDPLILRALSFVLEREGFMVGVAENSEEARRIIWKERPKLVILDIVMPNSSGAVICREVKADPELKDTRVIILTAREQEVDRCECISAGAEDFMIKPFSPKEILKRVRTLLPRE